MIVLAPPQVFDEHFQRDICWFIFPQQETTEAAVTYSIWLILNLCNLSTGYIETSREYMPITDNVWILCHSYEGFPQHTLCKKNVRYNVSL